MSEIATDVDFESLVVDFLAFLELERGLSRNTLSAYRSDLDQFGAWLQRGDITLLDAAPEDLTAFFDMLARGDGGQPPSAPATLARKVACLRSLYRHLRREGLIARDPAAELRGPRATRRLPNVLTRQDVAPSDRSAARREPARAARPRGPRADVRVRPALVRDDREGRGRRTSTSNRGSSTSPERVRRSGPCPFGGAAQRAVRDYLVRARPAASGRPGGGGALRELARGPSSRARVSTRSSRATPPQRASPGESARTLCATARDPHARRRAATCARCRRCSATPILRRRSSTPICPRST